MFASEYSFLGEGKIEYFQSILINKFLEGRRSSRFKNSESLRSRRKQSRSSRRSNTVLFLFDMMEIEKLGLK